MSQQPLPPPGKLQIPRLGKQNEPPAPRAPPQPVRSRPNRVSRACFSCRTRKIRCNGAVPNCQNCSDNAFPCTYASSRKNRLKTATEQNQDMMTLLTDLRDTVGDTNKKKIDDLLAEVTEHVVDATAALQKGSKKRSAPPENEEGEANVSAEVGSNEDLDNMEEDLLRDEQSRATGYIGKNSEVQWLRRLHYDADNTEQKRASSTGPYGPPGKNAEAYHERIDALKERQGKKLRSQTHTSSCSFYLDDKAVEMDFMVDPMELPPLDMANRLLMCYMDHVHNSFPILAKKSFISQFQHYYTSVSRGQPYTLPQKWRTMLNLVFAIGAARSHLVGAPWRGDERDHLLYHSRACAMSLNHSSWLQDPDLAQTQISGLLAFYYFATGRLNRSWVFVGMALRFGVALGMHVRNEDRTATAVRKEVLLRIWWSLFSLERTISSITGRPSIGMEAYCSVTLPLPLSDEDIDEARIRARFGDRSRAIDTEDVASSEASSVSSGGYDYGHEQSPANSGSYLANIVRWGTITQKVLKDLYSASITSYSWKDVQQTMMRLREELESWASRLPSGLNFFQTGDEVSTMKLERNILRVYYYSTEILICRPCLCRLDLRINQQTQSSNELNQTMASTCVSAARAITALLPDDISSNRTRIYDIFPWWAVTHCIMQPLAIIMLEISYEAVLPHDRSESVPALKKLVRWLRALRGSNEMAQRAYSIALGLLHKLAVNDKLDISDLLAEDRAKEPMPRTYEPRTDADTHRFSGEEFIEQFSLQQLYGDTTTSGRAGFDPFLRHNSPLANLFLTEYDQENPLPSLDWDALIEDFQG